MGSFDSNNPKNSVNKYHDGDAEGGGALAFVKTMSVDVDLVDNANDNNNNTSLQDIALSPAHNAYTGVSPSGTKINHQGLFVVDEEELCDEHDDDQTSNSNSKSSKKKKKNPDQQSTGGLGGQIRKWLKPT